MMLDEFVEANTGRPSPGFGFSVKDVPTLRTEPLVESCSKVIQVLTNMISLTATDALTVRAQDHAKDLKSMLQSYRLHMADKAFQGGVPEDAVPHLVEQTMMIQRMMSDHMNDLASLSLGISISRSSE